MVQHINKENDKEDTCKKRSL